jgi:AmiR/NasT family two-component response regulator
MMKSALRIAVADDEIDMLQYLQDALPRLGHQVVCAAENGRELVRRCRELQPDLIITDIKMPDMDGLDAAEELYREGPFPVIVVSAYHDPEFIERAGQNHILAYLVKPVELEDLGPAITVVSRRFDEFQALRQEANDLRHALEDRKLIERAKGILMKYAQIDEPAAFRRLQKVASSKNKRLVEVAEMIITTLETFQTTEQTDAPAKRLQRRASS